MAPVSRRTVLVGGISLAALAAVGYGAWPREEPYEEAVQRQRRLLSATPGLRDLVRVATLAANGHNSQPWRFRLADRGLSILPDFTRRTRVVDPDDHLYVSLGCATENLVIAAVAAGQAAEVAIGDAGTPRVDIAWSAARPASGPLYKAIPLRQSTRSLHDGQPIAQGDMALLATAARQDGVSVRFFTDAIHRDAIADFVIAGNSAQMDDPAFVQELMDWLRFSPALAVATGDGLFSACSGNPVMPQWIGERMFRAFFTRDAENRKYAEHIRSSAGVAVFVGDRADPDHWIRVGRSFQRFALQATALGIRTAHINQPVEVPSVRSEFSAWLGQPDARPDLVIRFGRAPAMPMSLRRPVSAVLA